MGVLFASDVNGCSCPQTERGAVRNHSYSDTGAPLDMSRKIKWVLTIGRKRKKKSNLVMLQINNMIKTRAVFEALTSVILLFLVYGSTLGPLPDSL